MRVGEVEKALSEPDAREQAPEAPSRALVLLAPAPRASEASGRYRQTPFLAHLVAARDQHAQARERRRATPAEAIAAYRAAAALTR